MTNKDARPAVNMVKYAVIWLAVLICILLMTGCRSASGAEKRVKTELDALKTSDYIGSEVTDLRESLSDEGKDDFDSFIKKLKDFDYDISPDSGDGNDEHVVISVRIKTYDFGTEYLATWTDYIREHGESLSSEEDLTEFYEALFKRLAGLEEKSCIKDVDIICIDPIDNGEWIANIKDNEDLQDAIFGGMMSEMKALAADQ